MTTPTEADRVAWSRRAGINAGPRVFAELRKAKAEHEAFRVEVERKLRETLAEGFIHPRSETASSSRSLMLPDPEPDLWEELMPGGIYSRKYIVDKAALLGLKLVKDDNQ